MAKNIVTDKDRHNRRSPSGIVDAKHAPPSPAASPRTEPDHRQMPEEPDSGVIVVQDMLVKSVDRNFEEMTGYTRQEVIDTSFNGYLVPDAKRDVLRDDEPDCDTQDSHRFRSEFVRKDERSLPVELSVRPIVWQGSEAELIVMTDITECVEEERRRQEQAEIQAVGAMARQIAHDFNNIFQSIIGPADLLLTLAEGDGIQQKYLKQIIRSCQRGGSLVKSLLTFTHQDGPVREMVDLRDAIEAAVKTMTKTVPEGITVQMRIADNIWPVTADSNHVHQLLMELATNAVEAMPQGGKLQVTAENVTVDEVAAAAKSSPAPGKHVLLAVADEGCGMDEETSGCIFRPFYTTKGRSEHTGLGLAVVAAIVEGQDGSTQVETAPGSGTAIRIYLPATVTDDAEATGAVSRTDAQGETATILLVDDDHNISWVSKELLERFGHHVMVACNGYEAIETFTRHHAEIDLVLLDLVMPEMDGEECLDEIMKMDPQAIVIIATGSLSSEEKRRRLARKAKGYIAKPFNAANLLEAVHKGLEAKREAVGTDSA